MCDPFDPDSFLPSQDNYDGFGDDQMHEDYNEIDDDQPDLLAEIESQTTPAKDPVIEYLFANHDLNDFYKSLYASYNRLGRLTERQYQCVQDSYEKAISRAAKPSITPDNHKKAFTIKVGQVIEIKTWLANKFKAEASMEFFLRNLEIVEVLDETQRAYQVQVRFVSKIVKNCCACGKALDNEISKATGIGPTCARKIGLSRPSLNDSQKTIIELEALCVKIGIVGPLWIPKSQIKFIEQ